MWVLDGSKPQQVREVLGWNKYLADNDNSTIISHTRATPRRQDGLGGQRRGK